MATKLRYIEHPAFSHHTPAQWCAVVEQALAIRAAYVGPRTNIFVHIDTALAAFTSDREPALALSCLTPRQRAYYRTAPVALVLASELQARAAQANGKHGEDQAANRPSPVAEKPARNAGSGVTRAIYQWTLDNPSATKADALQAFPSANPSTVSVQFGAARRARQ
jgi:hypothetical protein